jgi:hypothetical protein
VPVRGLHEFEVETKKFPLWKSNKKDIECQCLTATKSQPSANEVRALIADDVADQFSQRFAQRQNASEIVRCEIRTGFRCGRRFLLI